MNDVTIASGETLLPELINVDSIIVRGRIRRLRDDAVEELVKSIREIGLISPITIRKHPYPTLVSGAHRLEAVKRLGWDFIPCNASVDNDQDRLTLIEIDENLARSELSPAERSIHIARRKEIYERLHPETKNGAAPGAGRGKVPHKNANFASFSEDTAKKAGRSQRSVAQDATRAKHIPEIEHIVGTSLDKGDELDALARLTPTQQRVLINKARTGEKVSAKHEVKKVARAAKEKILSAATAAASRSIGTKLYGVVYADPPWRFVPYSTDTGMDRAADNHYPTMELDEIRQMKVPAAQDSVLFLWATSPMLFAALRVMEAWGFDYRSHIIWVKDRAGTGYWVRSKHEVLLIGTRGNIPAPAPGEQYASVISAPVTKHSDKPTDFADIVRTMFPNTPAVELFARTERAGWDMWGNQVHCSVR